MYLHSQNSACNVMLTRSPKGFTLLELLATVAIASILLVVGAPSLSDLTRDNQTSTHTNRFVSAVKFARSEAMKRGHQVTLCASTDGAACSDTNNWSTGWILKDIDDAVIQQWASVPGRLSLSANSNTIIYQASGFKRNAATTLTMLDANCQSNEARTITVSRVGHTRVEHAACPAP